jgi:hypothetical protein
MCKHCLLGKAYLTVFCWFHRVSVFNCVFTNICRLAGYRDAKPCSDQWIFIHPRHTSSVHHVLNDACVKGFLGEECQQEFTSGMACIAGFRINLGDTFLQTMLTNHGIPFHIVGRMPGDVVFFDNQTIHWVVNHGTCIKVSTQRTCSWSMSMYGTCTCKHVKMYL